MTKQYISVTNAAELLGYRRARVHQLLNERCPKCDGAGCERCDGTGKRLPATRFGHAWMVHRDWDVGLLTNQRTGEPLLDAETVWCWNHPDAIKDSPVTWHCLGCGRECGKDQVIEKRNPTRHLCPHCGDKCVPLAPYEEWDADELQRKVTDAMEVDDERSD